MNDEDILGAFLKPPSPGEAENSAILDAFLNQPTVDQRVQQTKDRWGQIGAGFKQGLKDIGGSVVALAQKGNEAIPALGRLDEAMGFPPNNLQQGVERYRQDLGQFNQDYGNSGFATAGRVAGNVAGTAPMMGMAGAALRSAGPVGQFMTGQGLPNISNAYARFAANNLSRGIAGAGAGAVGNLLTQSGEVGPEQAAQEGAVIGGALGVGAPAVFQGMRMTGNALTGGGVNRETAQLADLALSKYGIPIRGGQISNSPAVKFLDSNLQRIPLSGYAGKQEDAINAFTRAVGRTFGEDAEALTPNVMAQAKSRIGGEIEKISKGTTINADNQFLSDLGRIESDAQKVVAESEFAPLSRQLENVRGKITNGAIDGDTYASLIKTNSPLDRAMKNKDANVSFYAKQVREALDDAFERSAAPGVADAFRAARYEYRNMKTIEDLAEKATDGRISPALLLNEVRKANPNFAYGQGGDLAELARIGQRFLKEPPSSGTAERLTLNKLMAGLGGTGAAYAYDPKLAAAALGTMVGGVGAARLTGTVLDSPIYRQALLRAARNNNPLISLPRNVTAAVPAGVMTYEQAGPNALQQPR